MKTYRITKQDIEGKEILATGYKVIKWDLSTKGADNFKYGEPGENIVGQIWKVDGDIQVCKWGLHFSKNPADVFNTYAPLGYNRYFKVNVYEKVVDEKDGAKSAAQVIEFIEEYDMMEFTNIIHECNWNVWGRSDWNFNLVVDKSEAINRSIAVNSSDAVNNSRVVNESDAVNLSRAVNRCSAVDESNAVNWSKAVGESKAVDGSRAVYRSKAVDDSKAVAFSDTVNHSYAVYRSKAVERSKAVLDSYAVSHSSAVSKSYGIYKCEAVKHAIFCYKLEGAKNYIFNKPVTEERSAEVWSKIHSFNWLPEYADWDEVKGNKEWYSFCFPQLKEVDNKRAWSKMPLEMFEYIKSLPEYDEEIFKAITGE